MTMVIHNPYTFIIPRPGSKVKRVISIIMNDVSPFAHHWNTFDAFDFVMLRNSYCIRDYDIPN